MVQVFSDKSETSLRPSSITFYPNHLTLLNFKEDVQMKIIASGESIIGYLPVQFALDQTFEPKRSRMNREDIIHALHENIEMVFKPIIKVAMEGIVCKTANDKNLRAHLMLSSYLCDLPEAEDMLSINRNVNTNSPCNRFLVQKEEMCRVTNAQGRSLKNTKDLLCSLDGSNEEVRKEIKRLSMIPILPFLSGFPFVGIDPSVDIYAIFCFELMQNLHLGISKLLKECIVSYLKDDNRTSISISNSSGQGHQFSSIRRMVLSLLNLFLHEVHHSFPGYGLFVEFSKGVTASHLSGLFTEDGLIGMLEASDHDSIGMVSPFFGSFFDTCCGDFVTAPVTETMVKFVDLVNFAKRSNANPGWTDCHLVQLENFVRQFKQVSYKTFGKYQASNMGTSKWPMLDHLLTDIKRHGGLTYMSGSMYEKAHKNFKEDYKYSSKRTDSAMTETLKRQYEREYLQNRSRCKHALRIKTVSSRRKTTVENDAAFLVQTGKYVTLVQLETAVSTIYNNRKVLTNAEVGPEVIQDLIEVMGEEGLKQMVAFIKEHITNIRIPMHITCHTRIQFHSSAYVSAYVVPSLDQMENGGYEINLSGCRNASWLKRSFIIHLDLD